MDNKKIYFGTSNKHKLIEAKAILESGGFLVEQYSVDLLEPQSHDLEYIAKYSLKQIPVSVHNPHSIFVEDTGFFVESLNGFPGPYAAYALNTIGYQGILKLMEDHENRNAYFESSIAYRDSSSEIHTFSGTIQGKIAEKSDGTEWGFDPIFIPISDLNYSQQTFAVMDHQIKNSISHRGQALDKLLTFLLRGL